LTHISQTVDHSRSRRVFRVFAARGLAALIVLSVPCSASVHARPADAFAPAVSIVIDDLGHRLDQDLRAIALEGAVTCAFLPHAPHAGRLAQLAHARGKEIMLHLPMQAIGGRSLDDGGLRVTMTRGQFARAVQEGLRAVPHVRGVNNHMGSLLTQYSTRMQWLMEELKRHRGELYFVDSFTTFRSVAHAVAAENELPTIRRDIFLDAQREPGFIEAQFEALIRRAREHGTAIAIGHPYPGTMSFLEANLDRLVAEGIELLPVSALIARRQALDDPPGGAVLAVDRWGADNESLTPGAGKLAN
jgi:uncharacterized protein